MILRQGKRLTLRDITSTDIDVWENWRRPGHEWQKLDAPYYQDNPTEEELAAWVRDRKAALAKNPEPAGARTRAAIALHDQFIGFVSRYWISEETLWAAIGVVIFDPALWGQGYGYEAVGLWTDYVFESEPSFVRLDLRTWSGNKGMMRVAEKLGYAQEACFRKARIVDGQYYDGLGYGILREEWHGLK